MRVRTELKLLLMSDFDSHQGIPEANQPLGSPSPLINLSRPTELRIYHRLSNKSCTKSLNVNRPTYSPISTSSSVEMDPHNFSSKALSLTIFRFGEQLRSYLKRRCKREVINCLENQFNHSTIFYTFNHTGNYLPGRNSQQENTCVAVLTVGDSRTLHFKKRIAQNSKAGRKRWVQTEDKGLSLVLRDNSIFMLDQSDKKQGDPEGDDHVSQYIHGGIMITNNNDLSIAFAYHVVCVV